ncbi:MAG: AAA family ATPase [Pseudomonadota bacterium]
MTSLHADEAFLGHYQFTHDPFAARVPGFKFFPAQRKPVLGQLHHLARYSQLLLVVSGPEGSGKTLLRQALVASTNKQTVHSLVVSARGAADAPALLKQVAIGLNMSQADIPAILAQVAQLALTGQEIYLLVDDAEQLDEAALDVLLRLAVGNTQGRPHVFLFGEASLLPRLELLADGEERFHAIELQPYDEDETRDYLTQRLEGAGQGAALLSAAQVSQIHEESAGWPGAINLVARDLMIEAMLAQRGAARGGGFSLPKKHLMALAVVVLGVGAAWFMQGERSTEPGAPTVAELPLAAPPPPAAQASGEPGSVIEFADSETPLPPGGEAQPVIREPLVQASGSDEDDEPGMAVPEAAPSQPPVVVAPSEVAVVPAAPVAPVVAPAPPTPPAEPAPVAPRPPAEPAPVAPRPPVVTAPVAAAPVAPVAVAPKPPVKPVETAAKPAAAVAGSEWYRSQAAGHYALQILGTRAESSAKAFVGAQGAGYRYFAKQHEGKPLYVVTYGSFASGDAARTALKTLPAKVQAGKPWPRTFASIQQDIAKSR